MAFVKQIAGAAALGSALLLNSGMLVSQAQAAYVVTLTEQGGSVVATGSGTLDTTDLLFIGTDTTAIGVEPDLGYIATGASPPFASVDEYSGSIGGPAIFGAGQLHFATVSSGEVAGINGTSLLLVPVGYLSGASLSETATYIGQTLASIGAIPGTYVWTWGTGAHADTFTLTIGATAVPEPASIVLLGTALAGLLLAGAIRRA